MNNLNCLERVQQSGNEEKKCCPPNRDDETVSICAPLSQESEKACGSMEFADIDKDILSIDYNNDFERLMSRVSESAIQQEIHNENLTSQGIPQGKPVVPFIGGGRRKTRRAKKKRKKQTRRKRKKFRKTHN
jgi:hypothetical protein